MAHDHHHHDDENAYYLDQLCLVALSAAFGGICLTLWFGGGPMLKLILAKQFHPFVLASGIALIALVLIRAAVLWQTTGQPAPAAQGHDHHHEEHHHHHHEPGEACEHHHHGDHGHQHHEHGEHCEQHHHGDHGHQQHAHGEHGHNHDHDHDHGWAPWRYVVVFIPVVMFLLGLPSSGPKVMADTTPVDTTEQAVELAGLVGLGQQPLHLISAHAAATLDQNPPGEAKGIDFKTLEAAALQASERDYWQGRQVQVLGQFALNPRSDRQFSLVRFRIQCCAADAIQLNVPIFSKQSVSGIASNEWVKVTGRVEFREKSKGNYFTVLRVSGLSAITLSAPDPQQYSP